MLARTYAVDQWVLPALTELCERTEPLSLTEARQMRIEDVVLVASVREDVRKRSFRFEPTNVNVVQTVEAALAGKLPRTEGNSVYSETRRGGSSHTLLWDYFRELWETAGSQSTGSQISRQAESVGRETRADQGTERRCQFQETRYEHPRSTEAVLVWLQQGERWLRSQCPTCAAATPAGN